MEQYRKEKKQREKAPRIPIKTYRWEDIRRARLRGGYPWTYLYKDPFTDQIEADLFKMETRSKSATTLRRSSELDIKDVTNGDDHHRHSLTPEPSGYIVITEVPSDSESHSKNAARGSFSIEDLDEPVLNLEEAESSDDISQYLDKEEPTIEQEPVAAASSDVEKIKEKNGERAKSEEPKRKRKMSIESSYSRKSLSKLAFMKKLKEAKDKIKVPKLSLPKQTKKEPAEKAVGQAKPKAKEKAKNVQPKRDEKPVYIHIPLKPPEGETDEFSYLEFGDKKPEEEPKKPEEVPEEVAENPPELEIKFESDERRFSGTSDEIVAFEILKTETINLDEAEKNGLHGGSDYFIIQQDDDSKSENMIIIVPGSEEAGPSRSDSRKTTPSRQGSQKLRAKSAEPERKRKSSIESSYSRISLSKLGLLKKLRNAKDKLKFSLARSDSKKEPSKKLQKESVANKDNKDDTNKENKKDEEKKKRVHKGTEPKYIHIPLKPPEGETDEFSYLEFEGKEEVKTEAEQPKKEEESSIESPVSPKTEGVQFIFLTPPSDDEVLDHPDVPETPSTDTPPSFPSIKELKKIAKDAVDELSPKPALQPVEEEETSNTDEAKDAEKMVVDEEDGLKLTESAMAKQEQNVKSKEVEVKSSLKSDGSPILKKKVSFKRRSKDESKEEIYEDIQPVPVDDKAKADGEQKAQLAVMGNSQSMSVDEEKSYLDEHKIIKSTSLEEDYNRWSKLSDHEYEPVNPPAEVTPAPPPTVHVTETDQELKEKPTSLASSTTSLEKRMLGADREATPEEPLTIEQIQTEIENKFFAQPVHQPVVQTVTKEVETQPANKAEGPGRFQQALKTQTDKFKTKLHELKKPNIKLPSKPTIKKPNLHKFKFEKPKFNMPKMPDAPKISLPTFSLPRRTPTKRSLKERQLSTESNAGDSKTNYFDFRTYPRLFRKKPKDDLDSFGSKNEAPAFSTVPRTKRTKETDRWGGHESIRIPLHAEDSVETEEREDSVERRMASHIRYNEDIDDTDDAYEKENQEINAASKFSNDFNSRWKHGSFHPEPTNQPVTDLDYPEDEEHASFDINTSKDRIHSSESSLGIHRRGVLEEIDSDEFFLRQKGISQDNIEVGLYLSSEIREAFKSPTNALADLEREPRDFGYEARASNQSLPEAGSKRKALKKPKRKKTPHVSHEQISFDQDSELDNDLPPSRPKRRSRRNRKQKDEEVVIPYQETIAVDRNVVTDHPELVFDNEEMQEKQQPEIKVNDPYADYDEKYESEEELYRNEDVTPSAPPRKQKSLKSLNFSEHDSILGDFNSYKKPPDDVEIYKTQHQFIISKAELPPVKPERTLSRSSSKSRDQDELPARPTRSRSRTTSLGDSLATEDACVEEVCVQDFRDYMGYAVVDKNVRRDPPLPPPRRRSIQSERLPSEPRFFTVPRSSSNEPPLRPVRNYSTLGPSRPPRRKPPINMTDEEKEIIDITQYIEIEEEPNRDLHSGEVIQKMRDRPLPAPPRPPRKTRALHDISSQENIAIDGDEDEEKEVNLEEAEIFTQTQTHEDFEYEHGPEMIERRLLTPTHYTYEEETITHGSLVVEPLNGAKLLPDSEITKIEKKERTIPVTKDYDYDDETSEIPEEFTKLRDPQPKVVERTVERPVMIKPNSSTEIEVLKTQKLQVSDLDVDRLSVNELLANRIVVSEIESGNIQTGDISSKSGALKVGEIELPPALIQQLFERLQSVAQEQSCSIEKTESEGQKKTPIEEVAVETVPPQRPPRKTEDGVDDIEQPQIEVGLTDSLNVSETEEIRIPQPPQRTDSTGATAESPPQRTDPAEATPRTETPEDTPQRPPRHAEKSESAKEPEIDDDPPPRPPEPQIEYIPSQPPASFYALRAQQFVDDLEGDIPTAPRRRRHHKPPISRSSSEDGPVPPPSRRRYKSPEPSIPQLTSQLLQACGTAANSSLKRLIAHISDNVLRNADGQQDLHVVVVILLILIAGLILLGFGDGKTVHHHHWEFFNPPRDT